MLEVSIGKFPILYFYLLTNLKTFHNCIFFLMFKFYLLHPLEYYSLFYYNVLLFHFGPQSMNNLCLNLLKQYHDYILVYFMLI